jgi:hypothetical protein
MKSSFKIILIFAVSCSLLYSCCKAIFQTNTIIKNDTDKTIVLTSYKADSIQQQERLEKWSSLDQEKCFYLLNSLADSMVVTWDDTINVVHYYYQSEGDNPKAIQFSDPRNIFNTDNYEKEVKNLKCNGMITNQEYSFLEEDYLYAFNQ